MKIQEKESYELETTIAHTVASIYAHWIEEINNERADWEMRRKDLIEK